MDLECDYNYCVSRQSGRRRKKCLKKAIQDLNFDLVFEQLQDLLEEFEGYKMERVRQDLSYLVANQHKYYTEKNYKPEIRRIRASTEVAES
jgi:hypothetical protein